MSKYVCHFFIINLQKTSSDERPGLVASQGSGPLKISIRLSGTKEKVSLTQPASTPHRVLPYRQLNSRFVRVNTHGLNTYVRNLKEKRKEVLAELSKLRGETISCFPLKPDPNRQKCHYDYLLEESVLVANDFVEERKWKIQVAYILAHEAQAFYYKYIHKSNETANSKTEDSNLQQIKISHFLSSMVNEFWNNVKDAQNEIFHPEKKKKEEKKTEEIWFEYSRGGEKNHVYTRENLIALYANKPSSLPSYLSYCYQRKITSILSCVPSTLQWESLVYALCKSIRFYIHKSVLIVIHEK